MIHSNADLFTLLEVLMKLGIITSLTYTTAELIVLQRMMNGIQWEHWDTNETT